MELNKVTAPEYYDNDPAEEINADAQALSDRLDAVERDLFRNTAGELLEIYPELRVTRAGAIILVDEQPPMIDLRSVDGVSTLSGFYNNETEERSLNLRDSLIDELRDLLRGAV